MFKIWSIFGCHHASSSRGHFFDVLILFQLWIWITGIAHLMMDDLMLSDFMIYHTFDAILGHISSLAEIYRSSRSCMLTPTYWMHTETMTCSLFYHDPLVEPLLSHPVRLVFFSICMSSCFLFRETFPWRLGSIWITKITHLTMNDFMSLGFRPTIYSMPYWGIFRFDWDL